MIVVFIILLVFWTILVLYLMHLDGKIRELERRLEKR
ncbi:MAG TPA: CcmD family protein [Candidatus Methylomirabilis sp.]|nr:CcmD family protein [Candidatus Methylomirabilis sp.]